MGKKADQASGAVHSMTGFAAGRGTCDGASWTWDLRSVNGRGLDLKLRVPDWIDGLEVELRKRLQTRLSRGNVSLALRVSQEEDDSAPRIDSARLDAALATLKEVETAAAGAGLTLAPMTAAQIASMRGVMDTATSETDTGPLRQAILKDLPDLLDAFVASRAQEGAALAALLTEQVDRIEALTADAKVAAAERPDAVRQSLERALERVMGADERVDAGRLTQELALIATKQDITEEIDRLGAHIDAARSLLAEGSPIGRKLDFLTQEFNREVNTLCSKAQATDLTAIGLEMKAVIDQMREQVQNVE